MSDARANLHALAEAQLRDHSRRLTEILGGYSPQALGELVHELERQRADPCASAHERLTAHAALVAVLGAAIVITHRRDQEATG